MLWFGIECVMFPLHLKYGKKSIKNICTSFTFISALFIWTRLYITPNQAHTPSSEKVASSLSWIRRGYRGLKTHTLFPSMLFLKANMVAYLLVLLTHHSKWERRRKKWRAQNSKTHLSYTELHDFHSITNKQLNAKQSEWSVLTPAGLPVFLFFFSGTLEYF